jgi:hypothetical protein
MLFISLTPLVETTTTTAGCCKAEPKTLLNNIYSIWLVQLLHTIALDMGTVMRRVCQVRLQ